MSRFLTTFSLLLLAIATLGGCQFVIGVDGDLPADGGLPAGSESEQVQAIDLAAEDEFGGAVAIDGDTLLVGASLEDPGSVTDAGAAYVFVRRNGAWVQQVKLVASDASGSSFFGASVAIEGNTVVIGAPGANNSSGTAYVFERSGDIWTEKAKLLGQTQLANVVFGTSVAIAGDRILVGSPSLSSAIMFALVGDEWVFEQRLFTNASATRFGQSVALDGTTAIVGATTDDSAGGEAGAAYVFAFVKDNWEVEATLTVGVGVRADEFGSSVTLDGDTAIVGAKLRDDAGDNAGAAYVFTRSGTTWEQQAKLLASAGQPEDEFGASVSLVGDVALVGAPKSDLEQEDAGAAYVFSRDGDTWTQISTLADSNPSVGANFGTQVALESGAAIVGSPGDDDGAQNAGSVTSFSF